MQIKRSASTRSRIQENVIRFSSETRIARCSQARSCSFSGCIWHLCHHVFPRTFHQAHPVVNERPRIAHPAALHQCPDAAALRVAQNDDVLHAKSANAVFDGSCRTVMPGMVFGGGTRFATLRMTKRSPGSQSSTSAGSTRESQQPTTSVLGVCPSFTSC